MTMPDEARARALFEHLHNIVEYGTTEEMLEAILAAFAAIREECAMVAEHYADDYQEKRVSYGIAAAIRTGPSRPREGEG